MGGDAERSAGRGQLLPTLDAHAHLAPGGTAEELAGTGAVLACTLSLDEAGRVIGRREPLIAWGVGCHPRKLVAQEDFVATVDIREAMSYGNWRMGSPRAEAMAISSALKHLGLEPARRTVNGHQERGFAGLRKRRPW